MSYLDLLPALPELFLAVAAMVLLLIGVSLSAGQGSAISWLSIAALIITGGLIVTGEPGRQVAFSNLFVTEDFARFMKVLVLTGSALSLLMSMSYNVEQHIARFEYAVLVLLSTTGMLAMISANNLISLYVAFELQSLPLYVLAAFKRDTVRSTEAGLKYFVLGALSSGILLFGASLIYGFAGSADFDAIAKIVTGNPETANQIGVIIGIVLLSVGLAFKSSAVPFHMWTPDVYEGAPTPVSAFFAAAPKIAALALFIRVMMQPLAALAAQWEQIIWFISAASMILGALAAMNQTNIKRLLAYSSIGHVGYALMGLAAANQDGIRGMLIYLGLYIFMVLGTFGVVLCMARDGQMVEGINDLKGLSKTHPALALAMMIYMFSMAGIPPLFGIFAKYFVFLAAIEAKLYVLAVLGVVTSVVGCFYYIRIIKLMYFDEPEQALDLGFAGGEVKAVVAITAIVNVLFCLVPGPFLAVAKTAAATLFHG